MRFALPIVPGFFAVADAWKVASTSKSCGVGPCQVQCCVAMNSFARDAWQPMQTVVTAGPFATPVSSPGYRVFACTGVLTVLGSATMLASTKLTSVGPWQPSQE